LIVGGLWAEGEMRMSQLHIKKLNATNEKGEFLAPGGLTGHQSTQSAGTLCVCVGFGGGGIGLVVGSLWAEYKLGTCQLLIKKLKAANEEGESSAP